jgi:hypothetical protein
MQKARVKSRRELKRGTFPGLKIETWGAHAVWQLGAFSQVMP